MNHFVKNKIGEILIMNLIALINWSMRMFVLSEIQVRNSEEKHK